jgi:Tfp pilus assembly protein PilO
VTRRDRNVLLVVVMAAIIGAFWFLVMAPTRKDASALDKKIAAQQLRLTAAEAKVAEAQKAKRGYEADYAAVAELGQAVPADDDVASMVYQLDKAAKGKNIDFRSVKLVTASAGPGAGSSSGTGTQLPPGATVGDAGFPAMPFTFNFDGTFFDMQKFLVSVNRLTRVRGDDIAVRGRLLTIDRIVVGASRKGFPKVHAEVTATAYVVPADEGLTNGATPSGPATSTASSDSSTPAPEKEGVPTATASAALTSGGSR